MLDAHDAEVRAPFDFSQTEPSRNSGKSMPADLHEGGRLAPCSATAWSPRSMPAKRKI
jgi:hypothetical protein